MKVLLLGSGAREHALAWKLAQSPSLTELVVAPGNAGLAQQFRCAPVDAASPTAVVALARQLGSELVVVGPEAPLVAGVADALTAAGFAVFGPTAAAAQIEGSKAFAKQVMQAAGVPTARFEVFTDLRAAEARAQAWGPVVVKADGLAAGKGVVVADDGAQAAAAVRSLGALPAGQTLILEQRLSGPELSVLALCDGERFVLLPAAQDHKRLRDGDLGPNTGGMGAYCPAPLLGPAALEQLGPTVFAPTLRELARRGLPFRGVLFAGLMLTPDGPSVLEFNCRFGDPETQVLMLQLDDDLLPRLWGCAQGTLDSAPLKVRAGAAVGVVLAAGGYPESPRAGQPIGGLQHPPAPGVQRFFAGVRREGARLVTAGGRVLCVCAQGADVQAARALAYADVERLTFDGRQYRRDIAAPRSEG